MLHCLRCHIDIHIQCRQQVLWKNTDTSSTPPESLLMTPTCWYDWANEDPNFIKQFHEALMASKKKLHALALSLNKPVEFCIWYYYHKYKKNTRVQNSTSSDHDDSAQLLCEHGYGLLKNMMKDDRLKSSNECWICEDGGELVCCETCPGSVGGLLMYDSKCNCVLGASLIRNRISSHSIIWPVLD